jgi:hypothetical protein
VAIFATLFAAPGSADIAEVLNNIPTDVAIAHIFSNSEFLHGYLLSV